MEEERSDNNDAIHKEILLGLWLDTQAKKAAENNFLLRKGKVVHCHCCTKPIREGDNFIVFHGMDEVKRYAGMLMWKEKCKK